jgi:hypothetical protein
VATSDPKGYYAILGVGVAATANEINAAYRRLAKEYHPDSNRPTASAERFQELGEAYETLRDANRRSAYDRSALERSEEDRRHIEPLTCSRCQKIAVQPRYIIFWTVISLIFVTRRTPTQGIFCSQCASSAAWQSAIVSGLFGWWGFPWGPLWTFPTILQTALGGERRTEVEDDLLWHNAVAFTMQRQYALAHALCRKLRKSKDDKLALRALRLMDALEKDGVPATTPPLKSAWKIRPISSLIQASFAFMLPTLALTALSNNSPTYYPPSPSPAYSEPSAATYDPAEIDASNGYLASPPAFDLPPVPIATGELRFVGVDERVAPLEIVTRPGTDYFVKMVNRVTGRTELFAFIHGGDRFQVDMPLGSYEMRYAAGEVWYGEDALFGPNTAYSRADAAFDFVRGATQYEGYTVELTLQYNGNLRVQDISPSEF